MAADPIVYCLERVTDYWQFERLCNDLMTAEGYDNLEPLGGTGDKGRDAIRICRTDPNDITIFAYSVREDWLIKLKQDANRIKDVGHKCHTLVFNCTAHYSATERDDAVDRILDEYGWRLELYGLERTRTLLATKHERIISKHPHIFTPPFFPKAGGQGGRSSFLTTYCANECLTPIPLIRGKLEMIKIRIVNNYPVYSKLR